MDLCLDGIYGEVTVTVQAINGCQQVRFAFDCYMHKELSNEGKNEYAYDVAHALAMLAGYNFVKIVDVKAKTKQKTPLFRQRSVISVTRTVGVYFYHIFSALGGTGVRG